MNAEEARKIIGTPLIANVSLCERFAMMEAKGYLSALEGSEVKALVKALEYLDIHNGGHDPSNPKANNDNSKHMTRLCNQCVIEKALSAYRKAVQP